MPAYTVPAQAEQEARKVDRCRRHLETNFTPLLPSDSHAGEEHPIAELITRHRWFPADGEDDSVMLVGTFYYTEGEDLKAAQEMANFAVNRWVAFMQTARDTSLYSSSEGQKGVVMKPFDWFVGYVRKTEGPESALDLQNTLGDFYMAPEGLQRTLLAVHKYSLEELFGDQDEDSE